MESVGCLPAFGGSVAADELGWLGRELGETVVFLFFPGQWEQAFTVPGERA